MYSNTSSNGVNYTTCKRVYWKYAYTYNANFPQLFSTPICYIAYIINITL